jgi:hypothetical protein
MSNKRTWQSWVWFFFKRGVLIYLGLLMLLTLIQRHLIYFPSKEREDNLLQQAEMAGLHPWRDSSRALIGWSTRPPGSIPRSHKKLVVFHGNAGYALHRDYYVSGFHTTPEGGEKWDIYLFEYPGYGSRPGSPSEESINAAARHAIKGILQESSGPLYLLGESLGSSFASRIAAANPKSVTGLILVTPLTCLADAAASHYAFLPLRLILRESHNVQESLKAYPGPVAFLVAGRDEVMRGGIGEKLARQYSGRKRLWIQAEAQHNSLDFSPESLWWKEVEDFLK